MKHNFNAGPCVLPKEAVESTIAAIRDFDNTGIGLLEISHRTPGWERIMAETVELWRELLNIPENYEVLFLGGGASTQFFHLPASLGSDPVRLRLNGIVFLQLGFHRLLQIVGHGGIQCAADADLPHLGGFQNGVQKVFTVFHFHHRK